MMGLARTATLLVAFSLLTSAATASAECTWVLWKRSVSMAPAAAPGVSAMERMYLTWEPKESYKTKEACEQARPTDESTSGKHVCLPDTVDPRGPRTR